MATPQRLSVGFIGLGNMGAHMCNNFLSKGHAVRAFDVVPAAFAKLQPGATACGSAREVVEGADVVVTSLPSNPHVLKTYLDPQHGLLSQLKANATKPGLLFVDSSTVNPAVSRQVAGVAAARKVAFVDAPVSGGVNGAKAGTLTFMVGGSAPDFAKAKPILECMGKNIVHCGDVGTGQVAKICNNLVLAISMIGVSEAMNLGIKLGMDRKTLASIMNSSTARCWSSDTYNPAPDVMPNVPSSNQYRGGFGSKLMLKDLGLALDAAQECAAPTPLGAAAHQMYSVLCTQSAPEGEDWANKDFSVVYKFLGGK